MGNTTIPFQRTAILLVCSFLVIISQCQAKHRMGGELHKFVDSLVMARSITPDQADYIATHCIEDEYQNDDHFGMMYANQTSPCATSMTTYLNQQVEHGYMLRETSNYIANLFRLDLMYGSGTQAHIKSLSKYNTPKNYQDNGIVVYRGSASFSPPLAGTDQRYNGIWGFTKGSRKYVLQCHSKGLDILDATNPNSMFRVQFIAMEGGEIWRDVDVYEKNGIHYAYVGAQKGGGNPNLWVISMESLSGSTPHSADSNPISISNRKDLGQTDNTHTLQVNQEKGYLVLNSANPSDGCLIFDILSDPFQPQYLTSYKGWDHDCHDSFIIAGYSSSHRDVLVSADGNSGRYRLVDISNIRSGGSPVVIGETEHMGWLTYAHSCWYFTRGTSKYIVVFEESNSWDMAIHDITDPSNIVLLGSFQHSPIESDDWYSDTDKIVHNGQVIGNYLVVAYYEAGFRVFDLSDLSNPVEVGMYDTYIGQSDSWSFDSFNGAWNVYAVSMDEIYVSDQDTGTYVFSLSNSPIPSPVPAPTSGVPSSPSSTGQCHDIPGWYSLSPFFDCDYFATYGCYDYFGGFGHFADTACCACGGGTHSSGNEAAPTPPPPAPTPSLSPPSSSSGFNIQLMNVGLNTQYDDIFERAAERWKSLLYPTNFPTFPAGTVIDLFDGAFPGVSVDIEVDDVLIGYSVQEIDGYGDVLGAAGPTTVVYDDNGLPVRTVAGVMYLDATDFQSYSDNDKELIILHEMAHVFGLGLFWEKKCGTKCLNGDNRYECPEASAKYLQLGVGSELLLEPNVCGHFAEDMFKSWQSSELMTPKFEKFMDQPISVVTLAALKDLGFEVVYEQADDYDPVYRRNLRSGANQTNAGKWSPLKAESTFSLENQFVRPACNITKQ